MKKILFVLLSLFTSYSIVYAQSWDNQQDGWGDQEEGWGSEDDSSEDDGSEATEGGNTLTKLGAMTRASMIVGLTMMISALVVAETIT